MSARGRVTIIDLDQDRLEFVTGQVSRGRVSVESWRSLPRPANLDAADAGAFGSWVAESLKESGAGLSRSKVLVSVPRGNVVMKRLAFPGLESHDDPDLVEMARLSMTRQMPIKIEGTVIDFVPLVTKGDGGSGEPGAERGAISAKPVAVASGDEDADSLIEVLACAFPGDRVAWCREVAASAGVRLGALSLRASGAATLLAQNPSTAGAPVLGVGLGWSSVEFVVVRDGEMVFVRSADVPLSVAGDEDARQYARRVAVEAKRTWMAYRVSAAASDVAEVVVVGAGPLCREVAEQCGAALELPGSTCDLPSFVEFPKNASELPGQDEAAALAPLVGLMVARASDRPVFDFAHPRQPPDRSAGRRRAVLLAALGLIVVGGGGLTFAHLRVADAEAVAKAAETRARDAYARLLEHQQEDMRVQHLDRWLEADVDWLAHWAAIDRQTPAPPDALLDSFSGTLTDAPIVFAPGGTRASPTYIDSRWSLQVRAQFHSVGRLASRTIGNQFRDRLVASPLYTVESRGPDTENRFDINLFTSLLAPPTEATPRPEPAAEVRRRPEPTAPAAQIDVASSAPSDPEPIQTASREEE
ncbi:MAG: hypothetical protein R3B68_05985 [Phycisphaerales bacterium]